MTIVIKITYFCKPIHSKMNKLKLKINISFLLMSALLIIAASISVIELRVLDKSFDRLVLENYKTVESLSSLYDALEISNSGVLLLFSGDWEEGRKTIKNSESKFSSSFAIAKQSLSDQNEIKKLNEILDFYHQLSKKLNLPMESYSSKQDINWYKTDFHLEFVKIKIAINELIQLHQQNLYTEASKVKDYSRRAIMPAIISIIASLLFALILNFYIIRFYIAPLSKLSKGLQNLKPGQSSLGRHIDEDKSFHDLVSPINELIRRNNQLSKTHHEI